MADLAARLETAEAAADAASDACAVMTRQLHAAQAAAAEQADEAIEAAAEQLLAVQAEAGRQLHTAQDMAAQQLQAAKAEADQRLAVAVEAARAEAYTAAAHERGTAAAAVHEVQLLELRTALQRLQAEHDQQAKALLVRMLSSCSQDMCLCFQHNSLLLWPGQGHASTCFVACALLPRCHGH